MTTDDVLAKLERRLDRERRRRTEAERIAEDATRRLYSSNEELVAVNARLDALNEELRSLVYTVSHDLRNPVVTLLGYLELWERDESLRLSDEQAHDLRVMIAKGRYMSALIQDLLVFSRIGRVPEQRVPVALGALAQEVAEDVERRHPEVRVEVGALPVVEGDPVRWRQVFTNLLNNAAIHGRRDPLRVRVTAHVAEDGGAVVIVEDDGVGVPAPERQAVFQLFHRADRRRDAESTGIGLTICRKILTNLGGSIALDDADGGARVRMTLPPARVRAFADGDPRLDGAGPGGAPWPVAGSTDADRR